MTDRRRLACIVSVVLVAALTACSSPNPVLYTIAPASGATHSGAPKVIALRQIAVARYLERNQIVRSSENYRLEVMSNDWWGEPLGAMLARVLVDELGQRLPASTVYAETGAVTVPADATVELNVDRMDLNPAGTLVFQAQAAITLKGRAAPLTQGFRFDVTPPNDSIAGEVAAISIAVGQLADGIATMLATARAAR